MTLWFSPCSSCWPDSKQASNFLSYLMMHQRLFHFSFSVESRDHPVFHYSGWNIDTNRQHPVRLGVLSCPCTFMFWPALMPLVWLRKCCADARWPSDLCLLLMLRKAFFGLVFFFFFQFLGLLFFFFCFDTDVAMLACDMWTVVFSCSGIDQRGETMPPASLSWRAICSLQGAALPVRWHCG